MLVKMPSLVTALMPKLLWHLPRQEKVLYLTFDDGPSPSITEAVLAELARYEAKATFFCIGDKVDRFPETLQQIHAAGHAIGNHTYNHLNGWKTSSEVYLGNTAQAQTAIHQAIGEECLYFRPPYGRLNLRAVKSLRQQYQIVMWDVISGDFVRDWTQARVAQNVVRNAREGSIVVFHDSEKCAAKMFFALAQTLAHFAGLGYRFEKLTTRTV